MGESQATDLPTLGKTSICKKSFSQPWGSFLHSLETFPGSGHAGKASPGVKPGVLPGVQSPGKLCGAAGGGSASQGGR